MKKIHVRLNYSKDRDLINLMKNPTVDFHKLCKNAVVNYFRGNVIYMQAPPKISYIPNKEEKYDFYIHFTEKEEDILEAISTIESKYKSLVLKSIIRNSFFGGLLEYFFTSNEKIPVVESKTEITQIVSHKKESKAQNKQKGDVFIEKPKEEIKEVEEESTLGGFDLFTELEALGAAPH